MLALIALLATISADGSEVGLPDLVSPRFLEAGRSELQIRHRFLGEAFDEPVDDFLGADTGANFSLGFRSFIAPGLELDMSHTREDGEYMLGAGYNAFIAALSAPVHVSGSWYTVETGDGSRENGVYWLAAAGTGRFGGIVSATLNLGYDDREERLCMGLGGDAYISETVSLQGEYWPARDGADGFEADSLDAWECGLSIRTEGHQFGILLGNGTGIGGRNLAAGTPDDRMRLGLLVRRELTL